MRSYRNRKLESDRNLLKKMGKLPFFFILSISSVFITLYAREASVLCQIHRNKYFPSALAASSSSSSSTHPGQGLKKRGKKILVKSSISITGHNLMKLLFKIHYMTKSP